MDRGMRGGGLSVGAESGRLARNASALAQSASQSGAMYFALLS